jgi:hypothetical protein
MSPLSFRGELRQRVLDVTHQDAGAFMVWQFLHATPWQRAASNPAAAI